MQSLERVGTVVGKIQIANYLLDKYDQKKLRAHIYYLKNKKEKTSKRSSMFDTITESH
jgi:hypothetical protein